MDNYSYSVLQTLMKEPDKTILVVNGEAVTCRQFHARVTNIAQILRKESLKPGDRVFLAVPPSVDMFSVVIAVLALGGTVIIIDPTMGLERFNYCVNLSHPAMCVWPKGNKITWFKYIFPSVKAIPKKIAFGTIPNVTDDYLLPEHVVSSDDALITFTTGSTGMPKLLIRKHSFLMSQSKSLSFTYENFIKENISVDEIDCSNATNLPVFPLHYIKVGTPSILVPNFTTCDPAVVIDMLKKYNMKAFSGSIAFVHRIAQYAVKNNITLPVVGAIVGGSPLFRGTLRTLASVIPKIIILYGSTEAEPISCIVSTKRLELEKAKQDGLCVGPPAIDDSVKVIAVHDGESVISTEPVDIDTLELPRGEIGELLISGWHVNTNEVSEKRLVRDKQGRVWLRIEDAGYMDSAGNIWLVGRAKWRVRDPKTGLTFWSTIVEQKILDRTSKITAAFYLNHKDRSYLFIEAPDGLPDKEREALESFIKLEGIPVDKLVIERFIAKDRRHASKPNTAVLFAEKDPKWSERLTLVKFVVVNNLAILMPIILAFLVLIIIIVISN